MLERDGGKLADVRPWRSVWQNGGSNTERRGPSTLRRSCPETSRPGPHHVDRRLTSVTAELEYPSPVAVKIKLMRLGKMRAPYYRIVVADSRTKRDGRAIEEIGKYHPKEDPSFIEVKADRAAYWLSVGAQPTEAVTALPSLQTWARILPP